MNDDFSFGRRSDWIHGGAPHSPHYRIIIVLVMTLVIIIPSLLLASEAQEQRRQDLFEPPSTPLPLVAVTTACPPTPLETGELERLWAEGDYQRAAGRLDAELGRATGCDLEPGLEAARRLSDVLARLIQQPAAPANVAGQAGQTQELQRALSDAAAAGIALPNTARLSIELYKQGQFAAARLTLDLALARGEASGDDPSFVSLYASTLYNRADWLLAAGGQSYQEGLGLLATSACVDDLYDNQGLAKGRLLAELAGTGAAWPAPAPSELIPAGAHCGP